MSAPAGRHEVDRDRLAAGLEVEGERPGDGEGEARGQHQRTGADGGGVASRVADGAREGHQRRRDEGVVEPLGEARDDEHEGEAPEPLHVDQAGGGDAGDETEAAHRALVEEREQRRAAQAGKEGGGQGHRASTAPAAAVARRLRP